MCAKLAVAPFGFQRPRKLDAGRGGNWIIQISRVTLMASSRTTCLATAAKQEGKAESRGSWVIGCGTSIWVLRVRHMSSKHGSDLHKSVHNLQRTGMSSMQVSTLRRRSHSSEPFGEGFKRRDVASMGCARRIWRRADRRPFQQSGIRSGKVFGYALAPPDEGEEGYEGKSRCWPFQVWVWAQSNTARGV